MMFAAASPSTLALLWALISISLLILLIAKFHLNAFLALIISSLTLGLLSGMELTEISKSFQEGVGAVLSSIVVIIGLGAIIGKMVSVSGGAEVVADRFLRLGGESRVVGSIWLLSLAIGISVFFAVGLVILFPILVGVAQRSGLNLFKVGLPLLAGLSAMHGLVPPHAGPMAAIGILNADVGKTLILSLLVAVPASLIAGPLLTLLLSRFGTLPSTPLVVALKQEITPESRPGFWPTITTLFLPVFLMMLSTAANLFLAVAHPLRAPLLFLGTPLVALLIGALLSFYTFGLARGFTGRQVLKFSEECVGPIAAVFLVVGAGGGFSRVLTASGVGDALTRLLGDTGLSPLLLAWLIAALIRVATGSATVAITTAAGLMVPMLLQNPHISPELAVVAMGAGSLILSHVNDGGFWIVKELFQISVQQTLKTWTVMETVLSLTALLFALLLQTLIAQFS